MLILTGGGLYWYVTAQSVSREGTSNLSQRAEEFISNEKKSGSGTWSEAQLTENTDTNIFPEGTVITTDCFAFTLPFKSEKHKEELTNGRCVFTARVVSPPARLVVSAYTAHGEFEEDTGIVLRRNDTKKYKELRVASKTHPGALGFMESEGAAVYGYQNGTIFTISFASMQQPERLQWERVAELVDSFQLK